MDKPGNSQETFTGHGSEWRPSNLSPVEAQRAVAIGRGYLAFLMLTAALGWLISATSMPGRVSSEARSSRCRAIRSGTRENAWPDSSSTNDITRSLVSCNNT